MILMQAFPAVVNIDKNRQEILLNKKRMFITISEFAFSFFYF